MFTMIPSILYNRVMFTMIPSILYNRVMFTMISRKTTHT